MASKMRVLRILEYYGDAAWIAATFAKNGVKRVQHCGGDNLIREAIIGDLPIPLPDEPIKFGVETLEFTPQKFAVRSKVHPKSWTSAEWCVITGAEWIETKGWVYTGKSPFGTAIEMQEDDLEPVPDRVVLDIVFDGPPSHESGRFVEVEIDGKSVSVGQWIERPDGLWALRIPDVLVETLTRTKENGDGQAIP